MINARGEFLVKEENEYSILREKIPQRACLAWSILFQTENDSNSILADQIVPYNKPRRIFRFNLISHSMPCHAMQSDEKRWFILLNGRWETTRTTHDGVILELGLDMKDFGCCYMEKGGEA